ncbi:MAG: hypothetical protein Q8K75_03185 [Chlamydiales bacterium]|nr:hypothetical protein [Chlamydiales bacterium]
MDAQSPETALKSVVIQESIRSFLFWMCPLTVLDLWLWTLAFAGLIPFIALLLGHVLVLAALYAFVWDFKRKQRDIRYWALAAIFATFLGPIGLIITLLSAIIYCLFPHRLIDPKALLDELLPEFDDHPIAEASHRLRTGLDRVDADTTPIPFMDVMAYGSMMQKRAVISVCLRYFSPELTEVLRVGLQDSNNSVRVLAATAMVALEEKYHARFKIVEADLEKHPDDFDTIEAFANHAYAFALSHIMGPERTARMRNLAITAYEKINSGPHSSAFIATHLARLYLAESNAEATIAVLSPWIDNAHEMMLDVLNLYGEALFRLKRYDDLRQFASKGLADMAKEEFESEETKDLLMIWSRGHIEPVKVGALYG